MREWYSAAELAELALPDLPGTKRKVNERAATWRAPEKKHPFDPLGTWRDPLPGEGPGIRYHYSVLPLRAQARLVREAAKGAGAQAPAEPRDRAEAWAHFESLPETRKARARAKLERLEEVRALVAAGQHKDVAVEIVAGKHRLGVSTLFGWQKRVNGIDRADWLPFLVDRRQGRTTRAACDPEAWDMLKSDFLRAERPTFQSCYDRMAETAQARGWTVPDSRTLERRLKSEVPVAVIVFAREGREAVERLYPAQERDRTVFRALEAVNADFHKFDVFVEWADGRKVRPQICCFQDLHSGMILAWRIDDHPNKEAVRLAFGDLVETYGIPENCWLDNGREFAAKWITGGTPNRYRFTVRDEDPMGILTQLGVEVRWTRPYSGQSKPIERAFRDFCDRIAKDPRLAGAYTGNTPIDKPENYGARAVPLDLFVRVVDEGIKRHNARPGRENRACKGLLSFEEAFLESYAGAVIRKALPEQRRLWLLAAEGVRADRQNGAINLAGNRYWFEALPELRGHPLVVRFDPQDLHSGVHVYRLDGSYVGWADCLAAKGYADVEAGREHARARKAYLRAQREMLEAHRKLRIEQVADLMAAPLAEPLALESKIVRPSFGSADPLMGRPEPAAPPARDLTPTESAQLIRLETEFRAPAPSPEETDEQRFARAIGLERRLAQGQGAGDDERRWLGAYQMSAEYRARKRMMEDFGEAMVAHAG